MSKLSLAQLFDAPDGYSGAFAYLCGYSADALFLNDAMMRFTRLTKEQRANSGIAYAAMMLDPGSPGISVKDSPGLLHLPFKSDLSKPFALLHAKVGLLHFKNDTTPDEWKIRLIVSTGNWTRQTLEESLDLVWSIEVSSSGKAELSQDYADMSAASEFFIWLKGYFDFSVFDASTESKEKLESFSKLIEFCKKKSGKAKPRLFDNRNQSLLDQLIKSLSSQAEIKKRNYLALGSGFYESVKDGKQASVPSEIVNRLIEQNLLTKSPALELFVNPKSCQSIANSVKKLSEDGFSICSPRIPEEIYGKNATRFLHAKFLLSVNQTSSGRCINGWVYLGSGNLTKPGFKNKMHQSSGNLEAGVIFNLDDDLYWNKSGRRNITDEKTIEYFLPIISGDIIELETQNLNSGQDMPERESRYISSPISYLLWEKPDKYDGILKYSENCEIKITVKDANGNPCQQTNKNAFLWSGPQPRMVRIEWKESEELKTFEIPVIDEFGRIAATELPQLDLEAAWWQLASFPSPPDDGDDPVDPSEQGDIPNAQGIKNQGSVGSYPIRQMMIFLENIAEKQTSLHPSDWSIWCSRLEQSLLQMKESPAVIYFREQIKLNPLMPLFHQTFRPTFAEDNHSMEGKKYEQALKRVIKEWKLSRLPGVGSEA